jgi:hypothetical protein
VAVKYGGFLDTEGASHEYFCSVKRLFHIVKSRKRERGG